MSSTGSVRTSPTRGIIKNPCPPKTREGIKPIDEICTAVAETPTHLFTGDHAGVLTMYNKVTGAIRQVKIDRHSRPIRAIGIGQVVGVIVFGGSIKIMNLENIHPLSDPIDLKRYFGTDRSHTGYARFAAVRHDDEVYAIVFGDGEFAINTYRGALIKRGTLQNGDPRGLSFVGDKLYAFDENNRRYVIEY